MANIFTLKPLAFKGAIDNNNNKTLSLSETRTSLLRGNTKSVFYNVWCFLCIYTLAAIYAVIELRRKYQRMRQGNLALQLNDEKDQLRSLTTKNWVCVVTGGDRGIGWETTKEFLARDSRVIVAGIGRPGLDAQQTLNSLRNELSNRKHQKLLDFWHLNLDSMQSVRKFVERFQKTGLDLNTLVNNAGKFF